MDRFPNCSKRFECRDVVSGLVSVMLKGFHSSVLLQIGVSSPKAKSRLPQRQGGKLEEWLLTVSVWFIQVKKSALHVKKEQRPLLAAFQETCTFLFLTSGAGSCDFFSLSHTLTPSQTYPVSKAIARNLSPLSLPSPQHLNPLSLCSLTFCFPRVSLHFTSRQAKSPLQSCAGVEAACGPREEKGFRHLQAQCVFLTNSLVILGEERETDLTFSHHH